jgi:hypothetical protein
MFQELLPLAQLPLVHIGAAGKGAAIAADDRDLRLRVEIEAAQRIRQMPHQFVAEGVEALRPVEGQGRDLVLAGVFDQARCALLRHARLLRAYLSSHTSSKRQPLYWLLVIIVSPLTSGCQQVAARK